MNVVYNVVHVQKVWFTHVLPAMENYTVELIMKGKSNYNRYWFNLYSIYLCLPVCLSLCVYFKCGFAVDVTVLGNELIGQCWIQKARWHENPRLHFTYTQYTFSETQCKLPVNAYLIVHLKMFKYCSSIICGIIEL